MELEKINVNKIREGYNPRKSITGKEELKGSIKEEGLNGHIHISPDQVVEQVNDAITSICEDKQSPDRISSIKVSLKAGITSNDVVIDWRDSEDDQEPEKDNCSDNPPDDDDPDSPVGGAQSDFQEEETSGPDAFPAPFTADDYQEDVAMGSFNKEGSLSNPPQKTLDNSKLINKIVRGDCLKKLKLIPPDSVDLLLTDPPYGLKFLGKDWDRAIPKIEIWEQCLRVLKPGAFAFIMSAPRQDVLSRMIVSLEEVGFRMNFSPMYWTYATGFPKAHNISKTIDKKFGVDSLKGQKFNGSYGGFQPKPAVEVIICAMKPKSEKTYMNQALQNGKGITWLEDCRIPYLNKIDRDLAKERFSVNGKYLTGPTWAGKRLSKNNFQEKGRFPANLLISDDVLDGGKDHPGGGMGGGIGGRDKYGRVEGYGFKPMGENAPDIPKDNGGYSRFFSLDAWEERKLPFLIVPKASKREKNAGLDKLKKKVVNDGRKKPIDNPFQRGITLKKNTHPCVKPLKLMSYLITMGSRENDVVLDCFAGSGSTLIAAKMLNRRFIGIELDKEYHRIANRRIENAVLKKAA